jgi:hypothetical protein
MHLERTSSERIYTARTPRTNAMLEIKENTSSKQMANEPKSRGKKPKQKAERANESNSKLFQK